MCSNNPPCPVGCSTIDFKINTGNDSIEKNVLNWMLSHSFVSLSADGGARNVPNVAFAASGDIPYQLNFRGSVTSSCGIREVTSDSNSLTWAPAFNDNTTGHVRINQNANTLLAGLMKLSNIPNLSMYPFV